CTEKVQPLLFVFLYYFQLKSFKQMLAENFAEQGGGRRKAVALQGRQRSYAEFNATDVKEFYLIIV
ncbi:MAG: hypothetical protein II685_02880, partial [Clostridia bacterium]|nr:hypothetical protein [Clostridia bacterium]